MIVSNCCKAEIMVRFISDGGSDYYECNQCGKPTYIMCSFVPFSTGLDENKVLHETIE
jgi:hypothetical protein